MDATVDATVDAVEYVIDTEISDGVEYFSDKIEADVIESTQIDAVDYERLFETVSDINNSLVYLIVLLSFMISIMFVMVFAIVWGNR